MEEYAVNLPNGMYPGVSRVSGFRCLTTGEERLLPDSLAELWKTERVPSESLPGLLAAIEPGIILDDYKPVLHLNWKLEVILPGTLMGLAVFGLLAGAVHCGHGRPWLSCIAAGFLTALSIAGMLAAVLRVRQGRRKHQMQWLLEFAGGSLHPHENLSTARRQFWFRLTTIMFGLVVLVMGGIIAGASLYDRYCPSSF